MNPHAANALLKTLEEPPPDSYLILVSDSLRDLLPTMRSRCRLLHVRPPADAVALDVGARSGAGRDRRTHRGVVLRIWRRAVSRDRRARARRNADRGDVVRRGARRSSIRCNSQKRGAKTCRQNLLERWMRYLAASLWLATALQVADDERVDPLARALDKATDVQLLSMWNELGARPSAVARHDQSECAPAVRIAVACVERPRDRDCDLDHVRLQLTSQTENTIIRAPLASVYIYPVSTGLKTQMEAKRGTRNGILSLAIKDKAVLYAAYMPFVRNGGLFIPTKKEYELGDEVFMLLNLMDEAEKIPVAGKVVWMTPKGAQGNRAAGIGVQFNDQDDVARTQDRNLSRRCAAIRPPHAHDVSVLVDSHCHLNYFDDADARLAAARVVGVHAFLCIGVNSDTQRAVIGIAERHPDVWASAGLHPESAGESGSLDWVRVAARHERVVGIGETGLDYFKDRCRRRASKCSATVSPLTSTSRATFRFRSSSIRAPRKPIRWICCGCTAERSACCIASPSRGSSRAAR